MSDQINPEIKFTAIELIAKSLEPPPTAPIEKVDINFNFLVDVKVSQEQKIAVVVTDMTLIQISNGAKLAFFKLLTVFEVINFDEVFKKVEENRFDIPVQLEILLKSAGISTMRGVIYSELRGTYLQNAILPLIDIANIVIEARKKNKEEKEVQVT